MVLTGRAGLVAALSTLLILVSPWPVRLFWLLLLALALLIAVDIAAAASPRRLTFTRSGPDSIRLGESAEIVLLAQNPGRRLHGWVRDSWAPSMRAAPRAHRVDLRSGERTQIVTTLRPLRRGDHKPATVTVRTIGPLGIAGRQGRHDVPWQLRVLPPFLSRKHLPSRLAKLRELEGAIPVLIRGQGTEFDSLREYVVGDDVRSIDWRASARRNDVVVRTWRPERDRRILVVLDTGRTSAGRIGVDPTSGDPSGWPRLDWAMDAALLLVALASRAGDRVDFLAHDRGVRAQVSGASRNELLALVVNAMAPLEPSLVESDARGLVSTIRRRSRHRSLIVLLTDLNPAALEEGLLPLLSQLTTHHHLLVAAVSDPRVEDMVTPANATGPGNIRSLDAEQVYDAAAAERTRGGRRRIVTLLRRQGVEVVDAPPDEIAPALADRYLSLKASGRL
ncbi:DUF58 domain-containing protein [Mycobacteroides abscessus]|uniref:DUF58 domain-containing protein n=1 Tax=Mycobacteroides abscessus TaxID=36809 RepID=UPI000C25E873|nr:DUF58 domain-containing protein [Mycobacteroides abscessus]PVA22782.1 DUF58 domain-containing protein [Mycobacteroides abscessus]PVA83853.1 DUF58 domain-containing protein [Mycobacteroides abscessus]RIR96115.1 DUF58 domain-containing protein [Mycobacteroides abscessus]RIS07988.1 DUF58 domain-containing protein [Mycobacteroides abscessus]RIS15933.1 DUF58 domain-containing protein [Mycobacteroides abscessus]